MNKKTIALLLALMMIVSVISLSACGSKNKTGNEPPVSKPPESSAPESNEPSGDSGGEEPAGGESGGGTATGSDPTDIAINKYGLDAESEEWLNMSSERIPEEELSAIYDVVSKISMHTMDYDEVVEKIGEEPSAYKFNGTKRFFRWDTAESEYTYISLSFELVDGKWINYGFSKTNM